MKNKKYLLMLLIASSMLLINFNNAGAQEITKKDTSGTLVVNGTAFEDVTPDTGIVVLSVETKASTVKEASAANNRKITDVVNKLKSLINKEAGDSIKTSSYSIQPIYDYDQIRKKSVFMGYMVVNQVTVTTKQIQNVGNLIDAAVEAGANRVQGVDFIVSDNAQYCKKMLAKAVENAKDQANTIAQALGVKITGVKQVSSSCGGNPIFPQRMFAMEAQAGMSSPSTPIEAGEIKIQSNVNIEFFIDK